MTTRKNINKPRNHKATMASPLSRLGWMSVVFSLASKTTAFHNSVQEPLAMIRSLETQLARDASIEMYSANSRRAKHSSYSFSTPTRLHERRVDEEESTVWGANSNWWNTLFSPPKSKKQDSVDDYLEFLDRRYRRLHSDSEYDEIVKPFSAINWLLQSNPSRNEVLATQQQQEDALYVLGVAGLASQKLLQKHQLLSEDNSKTVTNADALDVTSKEVVDEETEDDSSTSGVFIRKVVSPVQRLVITTQHSKDVFVRNQLLRVRYILSRALRALARSLIYGPPAAANALLEICGGKKTLAITLTVLTTAFLLLRPALKAALTEASVAH